VKRLKQLIICLINQNTGVTQLSYSKCLLVIKKYEKQDTVGFCYKKIHGSVKPNSMIKLKRYFYKFNSKLWTSSH